MGLPLRTKNPPESLPIATCALIVLNIVVFAATSNGGVIRKDVVRDWAFSGNHFDLEHMLSSLFLHGNLLVLLISVWFLYIFGFSVEGRLRTTKFLVLYLVSGIGGHLLHQLFVGRFHPEVASFGSSDAILGLMIASFYMFPYAKVLILRYGLSEYDHDDEPPTADWPMWGICLLFIAIDVAAMLLTPRYGARHFAHVGGALGGLLACLFFNPKRDSEMASEAKAALADNYDLSNLSRYDLSELARSNENDPVLALNWMVKSLKEPNGVKQACTDMFFRLLPRMAQEIDIRSVAPCVSQLAMAHPNLLNANELLDVAARLEKVSEFVGEMQFYELAFRRDDMGEPDMEAATFRVGLLSETAFSNPGKAEQCYREILRRWPMGPFASQAKTRLEGLSAGQTRP